MRYGFGLGVVLIWLNLSACQWLCAADLANCTGVVLDENAVPVPGAQIRLAQSNETAHQAETDSAGRFAFGSLPAGDYQAEVRKQGFFVLSGRIVVLRPGTNEITFKLNHAQELHEQVQVAANANQIDTQDT